MTRAFSLGGSGGTGGHAQKVTNTVTGNVDTQGVDADGIVAQSIGGGGGNGGLSVGVAGTVSKAEGLAVAVSLGGVLT